jgi:hypothetical protein
MTPTARGVQGGDSPPAGPAALCRRSDLGRGSRGRGFPSPSYRPGGGGPGGAIAPLGESFFSYISLFLFHPPDFFNDFGIFQLETWTKVPGNLDKSTRKPGQEYPGNLDKSTRKTLDTFPILSII